MYLSDSTFNQDKDYCAWKGYDFDVINKLWDEDYIRQGKYSSRSKSVYITKNAGFSIFYLFINVTIDITTKRYYTIIVIIIVTSIK